MTIAIAGSPAFDLARAATTASSEAMPVKSGIAARSARSMAASSARLACPCSKKIGIAGFPFRSRPAKGAADAGAKIFRGNCRRHRRYCDVDGKERAEKEKVELHVLQRHRDGRKRTAWASSIAKAGLPVHNHD